MENRKKIEAYCYYKEQYPGTVLFFRIKDSYEIYLENAEKVGLITGLVVEQDEPLSKVQFPVKEADRYISQIQSHSLEIKIITWRDDEGEFSIPDVNKIERDRRLDY